MHVRQSDPQFGVRHCRVYSDRFIPSRSTSLLESGFSLLDDAESSKCVAHPLPHSPHCLRARDAAVQRLTDAPHTPRSGKEDVNTHSLLLRTELLGPGTLTPTRNTTAASGAGAGAGAGGGSAPRSQGRRRTSTHSVGSPSPSRNIFRFQQEREKVQTNLVKQFSLSPLGPASERLLASPRRPPRKIAEAPCVAQRRGCRCVGVLTDAGVGRATSCVQIQGAGCPRFAG